MKPASQSLVRPQTYLPPRWVELTVGRDARVHVKPLDPEVVAQMPLTTHTFIERGIFELAAITLRKVIAGSYPDAP